MKFLLYGATGWLGGQLVELLTSLGHTVAAGRCRLEDLAGVQQELKDHSPERVLCAAGATGRPNVDWCEDHPRETIRANLVGPLLLADACSTFGVHLTVYGTGCIYSYTHEEPRRSFYETEEPNFVGSLYSKTKGWGQELLRLYGNVLVLRIRMPISRDFHPRCFVRKILGYQKVINVSNSMTVLEDLLPISVTMALNGDTGTYNLVNPVPMSHNQVLALYRSIVDPTVEIVNFTEEEQAQILKAPRSNNTLSTEKLIKRVGPIRPLPDALRAIFQRWARNNSGTWQRPPPLDTRQ